MAMPAQSKADVLDILSGLRWPEDKKTRLQQQVDYTRNRAREIINYHKSFEMRPQDEREIDAWTDTVQDLARQLMTLPKVRLPLAPAIPDLSKSLAGVSISALPGHGSSSPTPQPSPDQPHTASAPAAKSSPAKPVSEPALPAPRPSAPASLAQSITNAPGSELVKEGTPTVAEAAKQIVSRARAGSLRSAAPRAPTEGTPASTGPASTPSSIMTQGTPLWSSKGPTNATTPKLAAEKPHVTSQPEVPKVKDEGQTSAVFWGSLRAPSIPPQAKPSSTAAPTVSAAPAAPTASSQRLAAISSPATNNSRIGRSYLDTPLPPSSQKIQLSRQEKAKIQDLNTEINKLKEQLSRMGGVQVGQVITDQISQKEREVAEIKGEPVIDIPEPRIQKPVEAWSAFEPSPFDTASTSHGCFTSADAPVQDKSSEREQGWAIDDGFEKPRPRNRGRKGWAQNDPGNEHLRRKAGRAQMAGRDKSNNADA